MPLSKKCCWPAPKRGHWLFWPPLYGGFMLTKDGPMFLNLTLALAIQKPCGCTARPRAIWFHFDGLWQRHPPSSAGFWSDTVAVSVVLAKAVDILVLTKRARRLLQAEAVLSSWGRFVYHAGTAQTETERLLPLAVACASTLPRLLQLFEEARASRIWGLWSDFNFWR